MTPKQEEKIKQWAEKLSESNFTEKIKEIVKDFEGEDGTLFAHFICNIYPCALLRYVSNQDFQHILEFNHFANKLIYFYKK